MVAVLGRTAYTNDASILRNYPGIERGTVEWNMQYKKRAVVCPFKNSDHCRNCGMGGKGK
ncbi:MAG: hypothetical protein ACTHKA_09525 [Anaerocolumna jejuensis]